MGIEEMKSRLYLDGKLRKRTIPKTNGLHEGQIVDAFRMRRMGFTPEQIAREHGVSDYAMQMTLASQGWWAEPLVEIGFVSGD